MFTNMDFFTQKELNGLKGDLKASEIALNADKSQFQKKLIETYGKEIEESFKQKETKSEEKQQKQKKGFFKNLFSI